MSRPVPDSGAMAGLGQMVARPTLTRRLLAWALGSMLIVWLSFVVVGYRTGVHEADELTDGHLASVAALLLNLRASEIVPPADLTARVPMPDLKKHDYQQSLSVTLWDAGGRVLVHTGEAATPAFTQGEGFADVQLGEPAKPWRSFTQWDAARQRKIAVLISLDERNDLADDIADQLTEPGMWLLPVVTLVLGLAIWRGLRPLYALSDDVSRLDVNRAEHLPARHALREFDSVVRSINGLVDQQRAALERERQLADEVAHELRTPLASISLQARALRGELPPPAREQALGQIEADALRAGHVLAQLLSLARAGQAELDLAAGSVDLAALARRVVGEYAQAAWQSGHELSFAGEDGASIRGHAGLIEIALRNLVENTLRHTPVGTRAEVQVGREAGAPWLQVCDDGGRPTAVSLARPARADSLGLGHKIVNRVADVHGARFGSVAPPGGGAAFTTCYRLAFGPPDTPAR